eukprot:3532201-Rhodomonas_salina.1
MSKSSARHARPERLLKALNGHTNRCLVIANWERTLLTRGPAECGAGSSNANWYLRGWQWLMRLKISPEQVVLISVDEDVCVLCKG